MTRTFNPSMGPTKSQSCGDVTLRHNALRNVLFNTFRRELACHHILKLVVAGSGEFKDPSSRHSSHQLGQRHLNSHRCHCCIPLNSSTVMEAGMYSGAVARAAELRKHTQNDSKCAELSWKCIPLAVECYGAWGSRGFKGLLMHKRPLV